MHVTKTLMFLSGFAILSTCFQAQADTSGQEPECPLLQQNQVSLYFPEAGEKAKVQVRSKPYQSCTFTWKTDRTSTMKVAGREIAVPVEGRLSITEAPVVSKQGDWQRVLKSYGSESLLEVSTIGSAAVWSEKRGQLSVTSEDYIYNVAVLDGSDSKQRIEAAIEIVKKLIAAHE